MRWRSPCLTRGLAGLTRVAVLAGGTVWASAADVNNGQDPTKPTTAPESNWIQTVSGRNFLVALRLYGTGVEFFDQTWKPDDVVKVD